MNHPGAALAVVVLAGLPLARPATVTAAEAVPATFDVSTVAVGLNAASTQAPAASVVTAGLVDSTEAYATSALSSYGSSESAAARFYPGDLIANGPALLCENFFPCPVDPPSYPLLADAAYPTTPTSSAPGAVAHASATSTGASAGDGSQGAGPVSTTTAAASTRAWVDGFGAHALSRSVVSGITIGPLKVALLETVDQVDVPAVGPVRDRPRVTVAGVTVAGQAASIDDKGVHLLGQGAGGPVPQLVEQGLEVRLLGASRQDVPGAVRSAAGGLLVSVTVPVSGAPQVLPGLPSLNRRYVGKVLVGGAGAVVAAGAETGLDLVLPPPVLPGSPAAQVTPPFIAPPQAIAPPVGGGGRALAPRVVASGSGLPGVLLYPLASVRGAALVLLFLPLLMLALWRTLTARAWRP